MRVLVVGDLHAPGIHKGYLGHCKKIHKKYNCNRVVFIGDIADMNAVTFHQRHPDDINATAEYKAMKRQLAPWVKAFPKSTVVLGNHDLRVRRVAAGAGIPECYLAGFTDWMPALDDISHKWTFVESVTIDGVLYIHGHKGGSSGVNPAFNKSMKRQISVVQGHLHTRFGIEYWAGKNRKALFGMQVGSGIEKTHPCFGYAKDNDIDPLLGCGAVINGTPHLEPFTVPA